MSGDAALRATLSGLRDSGVAGRHGFPVWARAAVAAHARAQQERGRRLVDVARGVGVSAKALSRWVAEPSAGRAEALVPVVVADGAEDAAAGRACPPATEALVVVTPRGYRVEGLTVAQAVAVLRELA